MSNKSKTKATGKRAAAPNGRLRPGELDGQILRYMRQHKKDLPLTASAVAKGIDRSSGAVANSLVRLTEKEEVRQAKRKPRAYDLGRAK